MNTRTHVIPVGGKEPVHSCSLLCWCSPLHVDRVVVHNAKDLREPRERFDAGRPEEKWVLVDEILDIPGPNS